MRRWRSWESEVFARPPYADSSQDSTAEGSGGNGQSQHRKPARVLESVPRRRRHAIEDAAARGINPFGRQVRAPGVCVRPEIPGGFNGGQTSAALGTDVKVAADAKADPPSAVAEFQIEEVLIVAVCLRNNPASPPDGAGFNCSPIAARSFAIARR